MDGLSFVAALIDSLAWPFAIIVAVLLLRRPLSELIPLLERLKYKDLELSFRERVHKVATEADALLPPPPAGVVPSAAEDRMQQLVDISPRAAILEAWVELEAAAAEAARRRNLDLRPSDLKSPRKLFQALREGQILDNYQLALLDDLRAIRNSAAHAPDFTLPSSTAGQYVETVSKFRSILQSSSGA